MPRAMPIKSSLSSPDFVAFRAGICSFLSFQRNYTRINSSDAQAIIGAIQGWNERKHKGMQPVHIEQAWQRLTSQNWL